MHANTIRKQTHELGRVTCEKPYGNKINRGKRFKFAKEMLEKPVDFWKNLLFGPMSENSIFGSDDKVMVWRTPCEEFDPKCNG